MALPWKHGRFHKQGNKEMKSLFVHYLLSYSHGHWWAADPDIDGGKMIRACQRSLDAAMEAEQHLLDAEEFMVGVRLSPDLSHTTGTGRIHWDARRGIVQVMRPEQKKVLEWHLPSGEIRCFGHYGQRHVDALDVCLGGFGIPVPGIVRECAFDRRTGEGDIMIPHWRDLPLPAGAFAYVEAVKMGIENETSCKRK
jgi:hypothetical protein